MIMRGKNRPLGARHAVSQHGENRAQLFWHGVAHGVGNIDRGGARFDGGFHASAQEIRIGAAAVLGRPFHVRRVIARQRHTISYRLQHRVRLHAQFVLHVQRAGADEGVDAATLGGFDGLRGAHDVAGRRTRQAANHRTAHLFGNRLHAFEIAWRGDWEAGFDDVHAEFGQRLGQADLFLQVH